MRILKDLTPKPPCQASTPHAPAGNPPAAMKEAGPAVHERCQCPAGAPAQPLCRKGGQCSVQSDGSHRQRDVNHDELRFHGANVTYSKLADCVIRFHREPLPWRCLRHSHGRKDVGSYRRRRAQSERSAPMGCRRQALHRWTRPSVRPCVSYLRVEAAIPVHIR